MKGYKQIPAGNVLQEQFDYFVKRAIDNLINDILRSYVKQSGRLRIVNAEGYKDIAAPEEVPDIEKVEVVLGSSSVYFENERLAAGIETLTDKHRQILECAFVLDMPNQAIGELMDLTSKTIRNYKSEAYGILRRYMEEMVDE